MNIAIVGAGIFGMAAAVELRNRGHEVTVFEQGEVPYEGATSTDVAKAIRRLYYGDNEAYVELVERAALKWTAWQERSGTQFYHQPGLFKVLREFEPGTPMYESIKFVRGRGGDIKVLTPREARKLFPQFVIKDDELAVYDPWSGYLESGRAVSYMAQMAREEGVRILESTPVLRVEDGTAGATVVAESGPHVFDRVIVAAGVWTGRLLPQLGSGLAVTHQQMVLIEVENTDLFARGTMPVWSFNTSGELWYGFPLLREGYVKVSNDQVGEVVDADFDRRGTPEFVEWAMEFLCARIPEMAKGKVVDCLSCLFAITPDDHFIIDWAPGSQRTLVAGGGSSHGFKFGGSIGEVIADALEEKHNPLGDPFRIGDRLSKGQRARQKSDVPGFALPVRGT